MPVLAPLRHQVELRGVLEGDALDEDAFTVREADKVRPDLFLRLVGIGNVVEGLEIERIPEVTLRSDGAAHALVGVPFRVTHLGSLHTAPPFAVSVDDALARDADVRPLAGGDARYGLAILQVRGPVGREKDHRVPFQVQVDMVFQGDGSSDIDAGRHDEVTAPLLLQGTDGLGKRLGIVRNPVTDPAERRQAQRIVRDYRQLRFRHFSRHGGGQVAVIGPIGAGPGGKGSNEGQEGNEDSSGTHEANIRRNRDNPTKNRIFAAGFKASVP